MHCPWLSKLDSNQCNCIELSFATKVIKPRKFLPYPYSLSKRHSRIRLLSKTDSPEICVFIGSSLSQDSMAEWLEQLRKEYPTINRLTTKAFKPFEQSLDGPFQNNQECGRFIFCVILF